MRALGQRLARDPRDLGREEEDYFSAAGDDDETGNGGGGPGASTSAGMLGGVSSVYMSVGTGSGPGPNDRGGDEPGQRGGLSNRPGPGSRWAGGENLSVRCHLAMHPGCFHVAALQLTLLSASRSTCSMLLMQPVASASVSPSLA